MVDYTALVYLLEILIPLAIAIYWLNYFYRKVQEIARKTDAILRNQEEILKRLAERRTEEEEVKGSGG